MAVAISHSTLKSMNCTTCYFLMRHREKGLPRRLSGKESTYHCRRHRSCEFYPWVRKIPWKRKWQPSPVFLPGESHGQRSLVSCSPWGPNRSPVSLSALNGSPMTIALMWGSDHCFSSPTCRAGLVLLALLFLLLIPSSYRVLCGSKYSFPLVRFSCLLSAGVLHTLLCLKVYF